jgi:hypothetical protein
MSPLLRPGLVLLAAVEWVLGVWAAFFPRSFYEDVPTIDIAPPFSEHLMRDFGGASLGLAIVLTAAAGGSAGSPLWRWWPTSSSRCRTWCSTWDICTERRPWRRRC